MKKYLVVLAMIITTFLSAQTSRTVNTRNLFWGSVTLNYKLNEKWAIVSDALFRIEVPDGDIFQTGMRAGAMYTTSNKWQWAGGGVYFQHYPNPNGKVPRPELRGWQECGRRFNFGIHHTVFPRVRFEQRFIKEYEDDELAEHTTFHSWRLRLRCEYSYAIGAEGEQKWSIVVGDEFMFFRSGTGLSGMDQNRVRGGFAYKFSEAFTLQTTYIHILQQRSSALYDQYHVLRLTLQFSLQRPPQNDTFQK